MPLHCFCIMEHRLVVVQKFWCRVAGELSQSLAQVAWPWVDIPRGTGACTPLSACFVCEARLGVLCSVALTCVVCCAPGSTRQYTCATSCNHPWFAAAYARFIGPKLLGMDMPLPYMGVSLLVYLRYHWCFLLAEPEVMIEELSSCAMIWNNAFSSLNPAKLGNLVICIYIHSAQSSGRHLCKSSLGSGTSTASDTHDECVMLESRIRTGLLYSHPEMLMRVCTVQGVCRRECLP
jgi:hypothetical protein